MPAPQPAQSCPSCFPTLISVSFVSGRSQPIFNFDDNQPMTTETSVSKVTFLVNRRGRRTHALLPIKEYERLIEDQHDIAISESRKGEIPVDYEMAIDRKST